MQVSWEGMEIKKVFEVQQWSTRERERENGMVNLTSSRRKKAYL
jgi:hypothetical protein